MKQAPLFTDAFSLCEWLLQQLDRESSVLARALCDSGLQLLAAVVLALKGRQREERLAEADECLLRLRMQLRLAGAIGLLGESQLLFALECADRIGRRTGVGNGLSIRHHDRRRVRKNRRLSRAARWRLLERGQDLRSANRNRNEPENRNDDSGVRCVRGPRRQHAASLLLDSVQDPSGSLCGPISRARLFW